MSTTRYQTWLRDGLAPSWLQGPWGRKFLGTVGLTLDAYADDADAAVKVRFVGQCPPDALSYHGDERSLPRGPAETEDQYRAQLADAWEIWRLAGTPAGITRVLQHYLSTATIEIKAVRGWQDIWGSGVWGDTATWGDLTPWGDGSIWGGGVWGWDPPDHNSGWWSRFWVLLSGTLPWTSDSAWGGTGTWGDSGSWGSTATPAEVATVKRIIKKFRPARDICAGIIVLLDGEIWYPTTPWASGVWGGASVIWPGDN